MPKVALLINRADFNVDSTTLLITLKKKGKKSLMEDPLRGDVRLVIYSYPTFAFCK